MKARIEKKLCKRLVQIAPTLFRHAWIDDGEPSELAYAQGTRVSNLYCLGGGVDYWGDGEDAYTTWESWRMNWEWHGDFEPYPEGHQCAHYPNTTGFKPTTRNLLLLAKQAEAREISQRKKR